MARRKKNEEAVEDKEYEAPDYASKSEWAERLETINHQRKTVPWEMARLMLWGIENLCNTKDDIIDLYDEVSEQLEMARKTLQNYASVARRFPPEEVHERLEIGHHIVVTAMPEDIAHHWLQAAEQNAWSVARLRTEIRNAAQTPSEDDGDDDDGAGMSQVAQYLARHNINPTVDEKFLSMQFPDGRFVNVVSTSKLSWSIT